MTADSTRTMPPGTADAQERALKALAALGRPAGTPRRRPPRPRVCVMIPAHNEAGSVAATIASLRRQTRPPDRVVVVADNCDDDTEEVALLAGAVVTRTAGNASKKAGALNQGLRKVLPGLADWDMVLTIDADSRLDPRWLEEAGGLLARDASAGAVCGLYRGEPGGRGLLRRLQRNEFVRAGRTITRLPRVRVLSGCGTLFRAAALRAVAAARGAALPGRAGDCFAEESLTEDYEITLALKTLGLQCLCSEASVAFTELMPTLGDLWRQRVRWQRGALGDLARYGLTRTTLRDWRTQAAAHLAHLAAWLCWAIIGWSLAAGAHFSLRWGAVVAGASLVERVWTVRRGGRAGMAVAALLLPELLFGMLEGAWLGWSLLAAATRRAASWDHGVGDAT